MAKKRPLKLNCCQMSFSWYNDCPPQGKDTHGVDGGASMDNNINTSTPHKHSAMPLVQARFDFTAHGAYTEI